MDVETVVERAWQVYRDNFPVISLGVIVSVIVSLVLYYVGYALLGNDPTVIFLVSSFLLASIYITSRFVVEEYDFEESAVIMARFVLGFSLFTMLTVIGLLLPPVIATLYSMAVVSIGFLAVPVFAETGFRGLTEVMRRLLSEKPVTYLALNWLLFLGLFAILSVSVTKPMAIVATLLLLFLFFPLYSLIGIEVKRWALQSG